MDDGAPAVSALENLLIWQLTAQGVKIPVREYRFAAEHVGMGKGVRDRLRAADLKDWRFDFAWPDERLAVEVEGGQWSGGRHTRGKGFTEDILKYDRAMRLGWTVYRTEAGLIKSNEAVVTIAGLLEQLGRREEAA
jgi:very-short-patch-repair endonuclease